MLRKISMLGFCLLTFAMFSSIESQALFWKKKCCNPEPVCSDPCDPCCGETSTVETEKIEIKPERTIDKAETVEINVPETRTKELVIPQDKGIEFKTETVEVETAKVEEKTTEFYPGLF